MWIFNVLALEEWVDNFDLHEYGSDFCLALILSSLDYSSTPMFLWLLSTFDTTMMNAFGHIVGPGALDICGPDRPLFPLSSNWMGLSSPSLPPSVGRLGISSAICFAPYTVHAGGSRGPDSNIASDFIGDLKPILLIWLCNGSWVR